MKQNHYKTNLVIVTWHQVYLDSSAGGYIRLKEFLKRIPKKIIFTLLDNRKTIYNNIISKDAIIEYQSPKWINFLQKKLFILWFLLETISSTIILYKLCSEFMKRKSVKVFYFPTAEFSQLYLVSFLIKKRFPQVKVVLDILNYGLLDENYFTYFSKLCKNGSSFFRSFFITITIFSSFLFMKYTLSHADYIVTVSEKLVKKIKKDYRKNTIGYTPSGVNMPKRRQIHKKTYLGIYIGRMTLEKGIFDVLSVWEEVMKSAPDAKLALAGYADKATAAAIEKEIKAKSLEKNVIYFGVVTEEEKTNLLLESELFIHLAHQEPLFPVIAILEGLSCGLPAVFYDMDVYRSAAEEFTFFPESMYQISNGNTQSVAKAVVSYKKLSRHEKEIKSHAAVKNAAKFDWNRISEKEFNIIRSFIGK